MHLNQAKIRAGLNYYYRYNIVVKGDSLYLMPNDFNKLLVDSDNLATNRKKEKEIIRKFIELYMYNDVRIEKIERKKIKVKNVEYNYEIISWTKINGIKIRWYVEFFQNRIRNFRYKILKTFSGNYIKDKNSYVPIEGETFSSALDFYSFIDNSRSVLDVKNYLDEEISFSDPHNIFCFYEKYVILKENGIAKPDSERTIRIELSGYSAGDIVHIN